MTQGTLTRRLQMPWGQMAYTVSADAGFPVVFLHGTGCDNADWEPVVAALPPALRVIRVEFRGHGQSEASPVDFTFDDLAADVLALTDHLGLRRFAIVGHSLGGMVAMLAAAKSPRVAGLVLLEGWTSNRASAAYSGVHTYGRLGAAAIGVIERKYRETVARFRPEVWRHFAQAADAFDGFAFLQRATIPIAEVYGAFGRTAATEAALSIPANPCIMLIWLPKAGHYLPHEVPAMVAGICLSALAGLGNA